MCPNRRSADGQQRRHHTLFHAVSLLKPGVLWFSCSSHHIQAAPEFTVKPKPKAQQLLYSTFVTYLCVCACEHGPHVKTQRFIGIVVILKDVLYAAQSSPGSKMQTAPVIIRTGSLMQHVYCLTMHGSTSCIYNVRFFWTIDVVLKLHSFLLTGPFGLCQLCIQEGSVCGPSKEAWHCVKLRNESHDMIQPRLWGQLWSNCSARSKRRFVHLRALVDL